MPTWFEDWLQAEGKVHTLRIWQPVIIPGLPQTAQYTRALFLAAGADDAKAEELVAAVRLERQSVFDRTGPPHVVMILGESLLHLLIGSATAMSDQLSHLACMAGSVVGACGATADRVVLFGWQVSQRDRRGRSGRGMWPLLWARRLVRRRGSLPRSLAARCGLA